jgi:hypothetical protein
MDSAWLTLAYDTSSTPIEKQSKYTEKSAQPKPIFGTAVLRNGGSADGALVIVNADGYTNLTTNVSGNFWQVDVGHPGPGWPDGIPFTVTITINDKWEGTANGIVQSPYTDVGEIILKLSSSRMLGLMKTVAFWRTLFSVMITHQLVIR